MRLQVIDDQANFSCSGCGMCCTQPYAIIIEQDKAHALDQHDFSAHPQLAGKKFYQRHKAAPEGYYVLNKQAGTTRCLFLDHDGLCIIHKEMGPDAKPHPCLKFPIVSSTTFRDDRVSVDFGCPAVQGEQGRPLREQQQYITSVSKISAAPVYEEANVRLSTEMKLSLPEYDELMNRIEQVLDEDSDESIWARFALIVAQLEAADQLKREGVQDLRPHLANGGSLADPEPPATVEPFASAPSAPSPVRMMFAATLLRDVFPPDATLSMGLVRRVLMLPKLMSLAKLTGRYDSKFLGREVNVDAVLEHPITAGITHDATRLLQRYFRTRIWQRYIVGTRLSVIAGIHQHIQDLNAILFLARAKAQHAGLDRITVEHIGAALSHVDPNIANQPRIFDQKSLTWFTGQLDSPRLAQQSLRLMAIPAVARMTEAESALIEQLAGDATADDLEPVGV